MATINQTLDAFLITIRSALQQIAPGGRGVTAEVLGEVVISSAVGFAASLGLPPASMQKTWVEVMRMFEVDAAAEVQRSKLHLVGREPPAEPIPPAVLVAEERPDKTRALTEEGMAAWQFLKENGFEHYVHTEEGARISDVEAAELVQALLARHTRAVELRVALAREVKT